MPAYFHISIDALNELNACWSYIFIVFKCKYWSNQQKNAG